MDKHYSPSHSNRLTNHLPMYGESLIRLGLPTEDIERRLQDYIISTPLRDLNDPKVQPDLVEQTYLDQVAYYKSQSNKIETLIRESLTDTAPLLDAYLFHGIIRLAFSIDNPDPEEKIRALAFWSTLCKGKDQLDLYTVADFPIEGTPSPASPAKKTAVLKEDFNSLMESRSALSIDLKGLTLSEKLEKIQNTPELMAHIADLSIEEDTEKRLAFTLGLWYLKTRDFVVLHVVNAFNALTRLKPYIDHYDNWLRVFYMKAQIYCLITDERLPVIKMDVKAWDVILKEIHATEDVHDIKLIYACMELSERFHLTLFNKIAHVVSHKSWLHQ